jgi:Cu/Zn superoxide dismutase
VYKNLLAIVLVVTSLAAASAQQAPAPAGHHAVHLVKLPNGDYTVPMSELQGSGTSGKVTLHPMGLRTLVTISVSGNSNHKHAFNLHEGKDCDVVGGSSNFPLSPAMTGQPSRTVVSLPITNLTAKNYVIDAQNAMAKQQFKEACARM